MLTGDLLDMTNRPIDRREFLAGCAAIAASNVSFAQGQAMRTRPIPVSGEELPVVGLGAPRAFWELPADGAGLPTSLVEAMMQMGGTMIDTPPFFQNGLPAIGGVIQAMGVQDELFLTGKITVSGKQAGIEHLERTESNLGKRPMDALMVHNLRDMANHWPTLKDWKAEGRARYIGVSSTGAGDAPVLERFIRNEKPDVIMIGYSIAHQSPGDRVLEVAADNGTAVLIAQPFRARSEGNFFRMTAGQALPEWTAEFDCESWAQFALKFILSNPAVTSIATETSKVDHVIDNMGAGYGRLPDAATRKKMSDFFLSL